MSRVSRTSITLAAGIAASLSFILPGRMVSQQAAGSDAEKAEKKALPLEAGRTIPISTSEGSWLSLDVSPDGQTVVFDFLGDLYSLPIAGGEATALTSGLAFDAQPQFSPDGSQLLFVSDRSGGDNLWTLDLGTGDTTQLTKGNGDTYQSPTWTPDGEYVIAAKGETRLGVVKLWMGHVDGGAGVELIKEPKNRRTTGPEVSADGRYIWHARRTRAWDYNAQFPQYQLAVYDRETGEEYGRTSRYGSAFRPVLSPDGRWLVYGSRHEDQTGLRIRDLESGDERWLAYPVQRDDQESIADRDVLPGMAFTPDSRSFIAAYDGKIWRIPVAGGDPSEIPFRVQVDLPIGPEVSFDYAIEDTPQFTVKQIRNAVPSPDGAKLAFTALDRLYVMDYPDGEPRPLTDGSVTDAQPAWSPDGTWIAFVTWSPDGGNIRKVRADGQGAVRQLTNRPAMYQQVAWSPDGDRIVALRGPARAFQEANGPSGGQAETDIIWINAEGGPSNLVAPAEGRTAPHFTENGERIYLYHGKKGLLSLRWDGSDEKSHVKVQGNKRPGAEEPNTASVVRMAPKGDQALAAVNNDLFVVTVPYVGGETPTVSVTDPDKAAFPARQLTEIGGQFPAWSSDGRKVHWSIGSAHFVYDLDAAKAFDDSLKAAARAAGDAGDGDDEDDDDEKPKYQPEETRIAIMASRDLPQGTAVLRGARVITMRGDEVIENADVLVRNNRIAEVGPQGQVDVPGDAEVIDVSGMTIVPGYVDTHAHMWPSWGIHKTQVWMYLANLAYGVTTTRDPQTSSTDVITYGDLVDAGKLIGPRVYSTGPGIFGDYVTDAIKDLDHARSIMKRYSEYYDTKTIKMYMAGNRQQRQWIIMAAREQGIMPTTEGGLKFAYNLTMMLDGYPGQEHAIPVYPLYEDVITLAAKSGIVYTPTLLVSYGGPFAENYFYSRENPHDDAKLRRFTPHSEIDQKTRRRGQWFIEEEHVFQDHAVALKDIVEAGGRVGIGSHGQLQGLGYHWELWAVQSGGMAEHDALRAATIMGAQAIGLQNDLGSIEGGKLADLVVLNGNPLDDIRNTREIRYVMKNGRLYDGDTLDEVWPLERPLKRGEWIATEPAAGVR